MQLRVEGDRSTFSAMPVTSTTNPAEVGTLLAVMRDVEVSPVTSLRSSRSGWSVDTRYRIVGS